MVDIQVALGKCHCYLKMALMSKWIQFVTVTFFLSPTLECLQDILGL